MPNSDQLKFMKSQENTPIPLRAHRKNPKPIEFPTPRAIPIPDEPLTEEQIKLFVHQCVHEQLRTHDERLLRTLHKVVMDWPIAEIMVMGEAEFEALCRSILEDGE